ncbi:MAG: 37S ribosomal protein S24, mitochondrial [Phylliscum demangeonii]|nr:MAG: 37S ribosomal protein S24, mitochondrial [Phylliscum demangeonii]
MAAWMRQFAFASRRCAHQVCSNPTSATARCRAFTSTPRWRKDRDIADVETRVSAGHFANTLPPHARAEYDALTAKERHEYQVATEQLLLEFDSPEVQGQLNAEISSAAAEVEQMFPEEKVHERPRFPPSMMGMGEEDIEGSGQDDEFREDDMAALGYEELEHHRELREYARITAWEMPFLSKLAKPFEVPGKDRLLRFRYTSYLGDQHPSERKVVVEFCTQDLPDVTEAQRTTLIKLVGVRYNPETDIVKMSCDRFETQAQNKRYLGDMVETLLHEARNAADTFADIPFDFRHHPIVKKPRFPKHWFMTPERQKYLEESRQQRLALEQKREDENLLIDGHQEVATSFALMVETDIVENHRRPAKRGLKPAPRLRR